MILPPLETTNIFPLGDLSVSPAESQVSKKSYHCLLTTVVEHFFMINLPRNTPPSEAEAADEETTKAKTNPDQAWEQAPIQFVTDGSFSSTHRVQFLSTIPDLKSAPTPPQEQRRKRWSGTIAKRATVEDTGSTKNSTTAEPPTKTLQASPSPEARKKLLAQNQTTIAKPPQTQQITTIDNTVIPSGNPPATLNQNTATTKNPTVQNPSTPVGNVNPATEPDRKTNTTIPGTVALTTPGAEVKAIPVQREKSPAVVGPPLQASPSPIAARPTSSAPNEIKLPSTPSAAPPRSDLPTVRPIPNPSFPSASVNSNHSQANHHVESGQLTSIAIGVACAASLFIVVLIVVIFKIRVSRKKALNRLSRFEGTEFFGSHNRQSFSGSSTSRNSVFVVPRPVGNGFGSHSETKPEKSSFGVSNFAGVGAQPTQAYQYGPPQKVGLTPYMAQPPYHNPPQRPPRSPMRSTAFQKSEPYRYPSRENSLRSHTPESNPPYNSTFKKGKEKANDLNSFKDYEYNDAIEYLDRYYQEEPTGTSKYHVKLDNKNDQIQAMNFSQNLVQFIGMNPMQLDDGPYDHRYTVDRNGILNNLTHSIPPTSPGTDYYYKKRAA